MKYNGRYHASGQERLARCLGWFSIGLGLAEVLAPRAVARLIGAPARDGVFRGMGLREIASGIGILTQRDPTPWVWSRVAGDVVDLSLLGAAGQSCEADPTKLKAATVAVAGVAAADFYCAWELSHQSPSGKGATHVRKSIVVNKSPEELYSFWRNFENLPQFMPHLESVRQTGANRSHWVAKGPAGSNVEWDAEIINETPNELIAWRSLEGADVDNAGSVRFERAPGGRGTVVKVEFQYRPPAGKIGSIVAKLFGQSPEKQVKVDLLRFKQLMETGVLTLTEGQPAGRASSTSPKFDMPLRS